MVLVKDLGLIRANSIQEVATKPSIDTAEEGVLYIVRDTDNSLKGYSLIEKDGEKVIGELGGLPKPVSEDKMLISSKNEETNNLEWTQVDKNIVGGGIELTKAEYEALSEEEKTNGTTYFVTDDDSAEKEEVKKKYTRNAVRMIAHRGLSKEYPENSYASAKFAAREGFWGTECDIAKTSDGHFVLMHDSTVNRTTDGTGNVSDLNLNEIKALRFKNNTYKRFEITATSTQIDEVGNTRYYLTEVPTLEEYLEVCINENIVPVIELKEVLSVSDISEILDIIKSKHILYKCVYISFGKDLCEAIKKYDPNIMNIQPLIDLTKANIDYCKENNFNGIDVPYSQVTRELIEYAHSNNIEVNAWTCDDRVECEKLIDCGIDYITTNNQKITKYDSMKIGDIETYGLGDYYKNSTVSESIHNIMNSIHGIRQSNFKPENPQIISLWGGAMETQTQWSQVKTDKTRITFCKRCYVHGANVVNITLGNITDTHLVTLRCYGSDNVQLTDIGWLNSDGVVVLPSDTEYFLFYGAKKDKESECSMEDANAIASKVSVEIIADGMTEHDYKIVGLKNIIAGSSNSSDLNIPLAKKLRLEKSLNEPTRLVSVVDVKGFKYLTVTCNPAFNIAFWAIVNGNVTKDYGYLVEKGVPNGSGMPLTIPDRCESILLYFQKDNVNTIPKRDIAKAVNETTVILFH